MCTAISFKTNDHYFGRNLDWEHSFGEEVVICPRNYPFTFSNTKVLGQHYAIIGVALVKNDYPLYFDATNEHGLSMAGLYFPGNALYQSPVENGVNVASYELIPWILCQCQNVSEAIVEINQISITNQAFSLQLQPSALHWIIADRDRCITLEITANGTHVHKNPWGVLTNNPPFEYHAYNICNFLNISSAEASNKFAPKIPMRPYSRGMNAIGLPGDYSSASRFVRAAFIKLNSDPCPTDEASITQFFHILSSTEQSAGCTKTESGTERTIYTSCCNTDKCVYYYTTYENRQITAVAMHDFDLNTTALISQPLIRSQSIHFTK